MIVHRQLAIRPHSSLLKQACRQRAIPRIVQLMYRASARIVRNVHHNIIPLPIVKINSVSRRERAVVGPTTRVDAGARRRCRRDLGRSDASPCARDLLQVAAGALLTVHDADSAPRRRLRGMSAGQPRPPVHDED
jgi:hypothetical protein